MSSLPRRTDYTGVIHVVMYQGSKYGWCYDMFGVGHYLTTILKKEEPQWDVPITCMWCALLDYGIGTPTE